MNKKAIIIIGFFLIAAFGIYIMATGTPASQSATNQNSASQLSQNNTTSSMPSSNSAQATAQDPQDIVPGLYPNPIKNNSTTEGFKIASIMVENNTDQAGNPVSDHLELALQNLTNRDLSNFEIYYTITDTVTNKKEGYYKKLANYTLKAGATQTINFDNKSGIGHFSANTRSLYFTSTNKLHFTVIVSTPGYRIETASVEKAAGGAETQD